MAEGRGNQRGALARCVEQETRAAGQRFNYVAANPRAGTQLGSVGIGPSGDTYSLESVDSDVRCARGVDDCGIVATISLEPALKVRFGGQRVAFFAIALNVSDNEIVSKVREGNATRARIGRYGLR